MKDIDPLNQLFNLEPVYNDQKESFPIANIEIQEESTKEAEDIEMARTKMREILQTGGKAIDDLADIARSSEAARTYEVLGSLMKNMSEVAKDLVGLHRTKKEIIAPKDESTNSAAINNQYNVVFTGTTSDILKKLKDDRPAISKDPFPEPFPVPYPVPDPVPEEIQK